MREKVNEDSRILKNWTVKELKDVRNLFTVPGLIGSGLGLASDSEFDSTSIHQRAQVLSSPTSNRTSGIVDLSTSKKSAAQYENFEEFVRAVCSNETSCRLSHSTSTNLIDEIDRKIKDLQKECETL